MFEKEAPKISNFFKSLEISAEPFFIEWCFTLFSRAFNLEIVAKIWDIIFLYKIEFGLYTVAIILFEMMEKELSKGKNLEQTIDMVKQFTWNVDTNKLCQKFFEKSINEESFYDFLKKTLDY